MAGRKPKPTALKKLEGNPGKRKLNTKEPMPGKGMPDCPKWLLPEAKKEWERLCVKLSEIGVLTEIDMAAFAAYCQSYARWKEAQEHIDSEGSTFETALDGAVCKDHVHMYVAIPPKLSVSEFMSYLKGKSALMLFDRHPEYRAKRGDKHFWARGYYVSTVGNVNEETIRNYIRNQEEYDRLEVE
jgi:P27 family predicted phage terminase small subunit